MTWTESLRSSIRRRGGSSGQASISEVDIGNLIAANAAKNPEQFAETLAMVEQLSEMRRQLDEISADRAIAINLSPPAIDAFSNYDPEGAKAVTAFAMFAQANFTPFDPAAFVEFRRQNPATADDLVNAMKNYNPAVLDARNHDAFVSIAVACADYDAAKKAAQNRPLD